jgi:Kef-type K+ transport system membrane component KefB
LQVYFELLVLLLLTRAAGEATERVSLPASAGEIAAGIMFAAVAAWLGNTHIFASQLASSDVLYTAANLGIFFLVLLAGIEMEPKEIAQSAPGSFAVAFGGMILPLAGGYSLAWLFLPDSELKQVQALLTGVALSISAIPATVKVLTDFGQLHSRIGKMVVSAAVIDDVLGLLLLAILLAVIQTGNVPDLGSFVLLLAKIFGFFALTVALGAHVYPRVSRGLKTMQATALEFSALSAVALAYGLLAEALGMHWMLGAFMAGLYFEQFRVGFRAYNEMRVIFTAVTRGLLGPLFFAYIGLRVDLGALTAVPLFLFLLIVVGFFGKLVGAGLPAYWVGLSRRESLAVGVGMSARGAVELVVISIAYEAGVFARGNQDHAIVAHLFSSLILMGVVTTLVAPILLRSILRRNEGKGGPPDSARRRS